MGYFEDSALWPILIVIVAHIVAIVGFVLLLAVRDRNLGAMGALLILFYTSFAIVRWEWRQRHALRTLTVTTVVVWILSGVVAYYGHKFHFL